MPIDPQRVQALFLAVAELRDLAERAALLDRECGGDGDLRRRVEVLLAAHDDSGWLPAVDVQGTVPYQSNSPRTELAAGAVFAGRFKIREKLGEGGMGTVYVADQTEPVARRVALKVIKTDVASSPHWASQRAISQRGCEYLIARSSSLSPVRGMVSSFRSRSTRRRTAFINLLAPMP